MTEQWVTMKLAGERLGIPANRISRWANKGMIQVKPNPLDRRSRLVDLIELQNKLAELNAAFGIGEEGVNGSKGEDEL